MPRWVAHLNKRVFNKAELKRGVRPVLSHVGRSSGNIYRTPLDACAVDDAYLFILMYGSGSDWVKNVLAAGTAHLRIDGDEIDLVRPRFVTKDVGLQLVPAATKAPPGFLRVTQCLRMDIAPDREGYA